MERGAITEYVITYTNVNQMSPGFSFLIEYPTTVEIPRELLAPEGELKVCSVTYLGNTHAMKCPVNFESRQIKVQSGPVQTAFVPEKTSISIRLGKVQNPTTPLSVAGFTMTVFTDATLIY